MRLVRFFSIVSVLVLTAISLNAQVLYGTAVGNVTDPSQGAVSGATVSLSNKANGYTVEDKTDDRGGYTIFKPPPRPHYIKIFAAGLTSL